MTQSTSSLNALALVCSLKPSPAASEGTDYNDLDETPEPVVSATAARNAVHLAHLLKSAEYPAYQ